MFVDCIEKIFKLLLKFLVQSLTYVERQRERGRERGAEGKRGRESTLYRKNFYLPYFILFINSTNIVW